MKKKQIFKAVFVNGKNINYFKLQPTMHINQQSNIAKTLRNVIGGKRNNFSFKIGAKSKHLLNEATKVFFPSKRGKNRLDIGL